MSVHESRTTDAIPGDEPAVGRHREILSEDPYFPHTASRAICLWVVYFFAFLGFSVLLVLVWPHREFGWFQVLMTAVTAAAVVGVQFLMRRYRVMILENAGRVSKQH